MSKPPGYMKGTRVSREHVLKELGYVEWPPKKDGEECMCGCKIHDNRFVFCESHQPHPA